MARQRQRRKPKGETSAESPLDGARRSTSRIEVVCWSVLLAAAIGALIWHHSVLFFLSWTDEQIHFYVAKRMAEGAVLYRDIDSARPPLVLFPIAGLIRMGCAPLLAGRAMVLAVQFATAGLLFWAGSRLASGRVGALAALLFLTSPEGFDRIHYTGIQLSALTASACVLFSLRAQPLRSGLFCGLTLATDQHGLVVCLVVAVLTVVRRPHDGVRFAVGALIVSGLAFAVVWALGGRHVWESLFGIHLFHFRDSQGSDTQFWEKFTPWLYEHSYLLVGSGVALALVGFKRRESADERAPGAASRTVRILLLAVGAHVAVVLAMSEAAFLYVVVIAPLLTFLAAIGFDAFVTTWGGYRQMSQARARRLHRRMLGGVVLVLALTTGGWAASGASREGLDRRQYSFWPHVRYGQLYRHQRLDVAWQVAKDSILPRTGTIFGDPTIVSAVALHSGLRVSGELADLNPSWLVAGTVDRVDVVSRIERDNVAAVITSPWFMAQDSYLRSYLMACYNIPKIFPAPANGPGAGLFDILVYSHSQGKSPCRVPSGEGGD